MSEFLTFPRRKIPELVEKIEEKYGFESEIHFFINSKYVRYENPVKVLKYNKQDNLHIYFESKIEAQIIDILLSMQKGDTLTIYQKQIFNNGDIHFIHLQTRNK